MKDESKTKKQLIDELNDLRRQLTGLKRAEAESKRVHEISEGREEYYRLATEHSNDGVVIIRGDENLLFNRKCLELAGYQRPEDIKDKTLISTIHPEDREMVREYARRRQKGEPAPSQYECRIVRTDGSVIWVEISSSAIIYKGEPASFSFIRDITERKQMEKTLRESGERYRMILENIEDGYHEVDLAGRFTFFNESFRRILGYGHEELMGMSYKQLAADEENADILFQAYNGVYKTGVPLQRLERDIMRKDGARRTVEISVSLIKDREGNPVGFRGIVRDTTERKRFEKALLESEEKYRALVENTPLLICRFKLDGTLTFVNTAYACYFGKETGELIGLNWLEFIPEAEKAEILSNLVALQAEAPIRTYEHSVVSPGGDIRWHRWTDRAFFDEKGAVLFIQSIGEDITEHKRAEEVLREKEERYRAFFSTSRDCIFITSIDGQWLDLNDAAVQLFGYDSREDLLNVKIKDLYVNPDDRTRHLQIIAEQGYSQEHPVALRKKDGTIIDTLITSVVRKDSTGEIIGFQGTIRDITDRKRAEAERLHLVAAIEQAAEGIYLTDTNWIIQYANPAFEKMLGYDKGEMIGWHTRLLKSGKHDRIYYQNIRETLVSGKIWSGRGINKKKDGTFIDADVTMSPVRDRSGNIIINYVCIHRDITREIALEAQLLQAQKMEAVGTLAGGIAHDFNNLLSAIMGHATLLKMQASLDSSDMERLERIEELVESGANMTRQLLGFARKGRIDVKPADMNHLLDRLVTMFGRTKREITVHKKFEKKLWATEVDSGQIEQVFMNLFVNAWQAMPGGGNIFLETSNLTIHPGEPNHDYMVPGDYVKISVTDTGTGMDETTKTRLFEPFFTTKEIGRGTGLGLATVYGIIKGHNGYINVYSEKGQGTTFNIYLPSSVKEASKEKEKPSKKPVGGKESILLIDDDEEIAGVMEQMLEFLGYTVFVARSGQEGLEVYTHYKDKVDLVILDMIMPGMGGGETFGRLREMNPDIKVILSSGYSINGQAMDIMNRGCKGFIQKPVKIAELSQKIQEMMGKKD